MPYLDYHGLTTFKQKLDNVFETKLDADLKGAANGLAELNSSGKLEASQMPQLTKTDVGLSNVDNKSSATIRSEITSANITTALGYSPINSNKKGAVNGLAELNGDGVVPTSQLPAAHILPEVDEDDNTKVLMVEGGAWSASTLLSACGVRF